MPVYRVPVLFEDSDEVVMLTDKALIKAIPTISVLMWLDSVRWEETGIIYEKVVRINFPRQAGELVFSKVLSYRDAPCMLHPKIEDYPELATKNTEELKDIIECASFLGCETFVKCVGFVIADRIRNWPVEDIARYFGLAMANSQEYVRPPWAPRQRTNRRRRNGRGN